MLDADEEALVARCKSGCEQAIQELWESEGTRALESVQKYLGKRTPPAYLPESYITFREMITLFDPDRNASFYTALCSRLKRENQGLSEEDRSKGGIKHPRNARDIPSVGELNNEDLIHWDDVPEFEAYEMFNRAEEYLTIRQAQIAGLRIFQGLSLREIQEEIDLSYGQVNRDWQEAVRVLMKVL